MSLVQPKKKNNNKNYEMIFIQIERINLTSMIDANSLFSTRGTAAISEFACNANYWPDSNFPY